MSKLAQIEVGDMLTYLEIYPPALKRTVGEGWRARTRKITHSLLVPSPSVGRASIRTYHAADDWVYLLCPDLHSAGPEQMGRLLRIGALRSQIC